MLHKDFKETHEKATYTNHTQQQAHFWRVLKAKDVESTIAIICFVYWSSVKFFENTFRKEKKQYYYVFFWNVHTSRSADDYNKIYDDEKKKISS